MGKLYELLAVEEDRRGKATKIINESLTTFKNKQQHFVEQVITFKPNAEGQVNRLEGHTAMTTSVKAKLAYATRALESYYDVVMQKERTNTTAKADVVLSDGTVFLTEVPATALLALEKEMTRVMDMYNALPTLEPGVPWKPCLERDEGTYIVTESKIRTKKVMKPVVLYEATENHPAQVKESTEDVQVGEVETTIYSSKLSSKDKSELLDRLDNLKTAFKKARMRANAQKVENVKVGEKIFKYLNEGKIV